MSGCCLLLTALTLLIPTAGRHRINLVDFGEVVRFTGNETKPQARPIERGPDGWDAWCDDEGQYMIGVEWDEPRDLAEVNIEFRHAIANRDKIEVQYYLEPTDSQRQQKGRWVSAKIAEWWAGDRDVSFTFRPGKEDTGGGSGDQTTRRTRRLRFLLGKNDLPPVRYIRAYGPSPVAEGTFVLRLEPGSKLQPPLAVRVINGYILQGEEKTTTQSAQISAPAKLSVCYATATGPAPNRTTVRLANDDSELMASFQPAEVARKGELRLPAGVVLQHAAGPETRTASRPVNSR